MRDMNVKIENKEVICTHGFGDITNNGKRFADICLEHKLVLDRAVFHTKDCTDKAAGSRLNMVDHQCKSRKFRKIFVDVREHAQMLAQTS